MLIVVFTDFAAIHRGSWLEARPVAFPVDQNGSQEKGGHDHDGKGDDPSKQVVTLRRRGSEDVLSVILDELGDHLYVGMAAVESSADLCAAVNRVVALTSGKGFAVAVTAQANQFLGNSFGLSGGGRVPIVDAKEQQKKWNRDVVRQSLHLFGGRYRLCDFAV